MKNQTLKNLTERDLITMDGTQGFTQDQIDAMNVELDARMEGIERDTDEWHQEIKRIAEEITQR